MLRRELLGFLAGVGAVASAGCERLGVSAGTDDVSPVTIDTIDAPGSEAGRLTVPATDRVTVLAFFATTCPACAEEMATLAAAHDTVGDDVLFVSVTSEPVGATISRAELADWWATHGGSWPVGVDDGTTLAQRYDATRLPKHVVVRAGGTVAWSHQGQVDADTLVGAVRGARDGEDR